MLEKISSKLNYKFNIFHFFRYKFLFSLPFLKKSLLLYAFNYKKNAKFMQS